MTVTLTTGYRRGHIRTDISTVIQRRLFKGHATLHHWSWSSGYRPVRSRKLLDLPVKFQLQDFPQMKITNIEGPNAFTCVTHRTERVKCVHFRSEHCICDSVMCSSALVNYRTYFVKG
jgi:hypothetical protein